MSFAGEEIRHAEEYAGHDHKPDHDPSGLHHLPAIRPLYSLQLAPASLKEVDQAAAGVPAGLVARRRAGARRELVAGIGRLVLVGVDPELLLGFALLPLELELELGRLGLDLLLGLLGLDLVGLLCEIGPAKRQLSLGELDVGRGVLDRIGRLVTRPSRVPRTASHRSPVGARGAPSLVCGCEPRRAPASPSAFRGGRCGTCTSGSTCAAGAAPGCSACSYSSGSSGACTLRTREWQRSGRLHGPFTALPVRRFVIRIGDRAAGVSANAARRRTPV